MSVTVTDNQRITTLRHILADYELHHSQPNAEEASVAPPPNPHPASQSSSDAPIEWEDQWRRVPAYRAANEQLDAARNTYLSEIERNFVRVMFGGVNMMSTASHWWRATGGRLNSDLFKYAIGGEW
ncbi:hypothetical protein D0862_09733 [Hortaea werneckii]|uniref:Uncharacterized protein n=1 Tax=Hortaea werneckii TaxID=91943 RepID=A0A3M7FRE9_HORWE|nr:hypothetical protein D0862_09733 [Hortaea werneckii]